MKTNNVHSPKVLVNILCHDIKLKYLKKSFDSIRSMNGKFALKGVCFRDQHETIDFFRSKGLNIDSYERPQKIGDNLSILYYAGMPEVELYQLSWLRNQCLKKAKNYDYILFVDSDIIIKKEMLEELLKADKQIIGGWYFNRRIPAVSTDIPNAIIDRVMNDKIICRVRTIGTGCTLIRNDIFKKERFPEENIRYGEDWDFYLNLNDRGYGVWCHTKFYCKHLDQFEYEAGEYKNIKIKEWNL